MSSLPITAATDRAHVAAAIADWRTRAACRGRAQLMDAPDRPTQDAAIHLCLSCPVLADCRAWLAGLTDTGDPGGVAGGWTEQERRRGRVIAYCRERNRRRGQVGACVGKEEP